VNNGPTSDATSKGKERPTALEIEKIARNATSHHLQDELRSEWKSLLSQRKLTNVSGSSTSAQPGSSTSTPSTADPSDSTIGDAGASADTDVTIVYDPDVGASADTDVTIVDDPESTKAPSTAVEGLAASPPPTSPDAGQGNNSAMPDNLARGILEDATRWPAWLCAAVDYFKGISASPEWVELVEKWVSFEAHLSFPSTVSIFYLFCVVG
jgi:hypothetical protein